MLTLTQQELDFLSELLYHTGADEITYNTDGERECYTIRWSNIGVDSKSSFDRGLIKLYKYNSFRFACEVI